MKDEREPLLRLKYLCNPHEHSKPGFQAIALPVLAEMEMRGLDDVNAAQLVGEDSTFLRVHVSILLPQDCQWGRISMTHPAWRNI